MDRAVLCRLSFRSLVFLADRHCERRNGPRAPYRHGLDPRPLPYIVSQATHSAFETYAGWSKGSPNLRMTLAIQYVCGQLHGDVLHEITAPGRIAGGPSLTYTLVNTEILISSARG